MARKKTGIENITEKIVAETDAEAKRIKETAKRETAKVEKQSKARQEEHKRRFDERTEVLLASLTQKSLAQARLEVKKRHLRKREELIDGFIGDVFAEMDRKGKEYERFIAAILAENLAHLSGAITITCAKQDVPLAIKLAKDASVKAGNVDGGIILEDATGKRIDESFDALLARKRDAIRQAAAVLMEPRAERQKSR